MKIHNGAITAPLAFGGYDKYPSTDKAEQQKKKRKIEKREAQKFSNTDILFCPQCNRPYQLPLNSSSKTDYYEYDDFKKSAVADVICPECSVKNGRKPTKFNRRMKFKVGQKVGMFKILEVKIAGGQGIYICECNNCGKIYKLRSNTVRLKVCGCKNKKIKKN